MQTGYQINEARPEQTGASFFRGHAAPLAMIALLCAVAYSNSFSVPFQFDDPSTITGEPLVRTGSFLRLLALPRGVGSLTFALNYAAHGADVAGYHIVNLIIHVLNALLVYGLVVLSFRTPLLERSSLRSRSSAIAFFSALLFAVHPVQTQAVTYIVQRFTSLATLFYLASLAAYIQSRFSGLANRPKTATLAWYILSLLSAVLAMKTKEIAFTLPAVITLYEFLLFKGTAVKRVVLLAPLLLTMLIIPLSLLGTARPLGAMISDVSEATRVQTDMTRGDYLATEFTVIVTYLRLLVFPYHQNLDYDYPVSHSFLEPRVGFSFLLLALLFGAGLYALRRDSSPPGGGRLAAFGIFWFFMTLSVESSVIPIVDVIFEHRLYLPSAGMFIAVTTALVLGAERLMHRWAGVGKAVTAVLAAGAVVFAGLTYARNMVWQSEVGLWENVIALSPAKARGYNGLGLAYQHLLRFDQALASFNRAIALDQEYIDAYNGRGLTFEKMGQFGKAVEDYNKAIALDPSLPESYFNRGIAFYKIGLVGRAIEDYGKAIALNPAYYAAYINRGVAEGRMGLHDKAIEDFNQAVLVEPQPADAYSNRGIVHALSGRYDQALSDFSKAIALNQNQAESYINRGKVYWKTGDHDRARIDFQKACDLGYENGCSALHEL